MADQPTSISTLSELHGGLTRPSATQRMRSLTAIFGHREGFCDFGRMVIFLGLTLLVELSTSNDMAPLPIIECRVVLQQKMWF